MEIQPCYINGILFCKFLLWVVSCCNTCWWYTDSSIFELFAVAVDKIYSSCYKFILRAMYNNFNDKANIGGQNPLKYFDLLLVETIDLYDSDWNHKFPVVWLRVRVFPFTYFKKLLFSPWEWFCSKFGWVLYRLKLFANHRDIPDCSLYIKTQSKTFYHLRVARSHSQKRCWMVSFSLSQ